MSRPRLLLSLLVLGVLASTSPTVPAAAQSSNVVEIFTLSTRADLVSGGDVLVEVVLPEGVEAAQVRVDVDGQDVTDAFAVRDDGRYLGRVEGLPLGPSTLTATLADGSGARLAVTNHPIGGPVFSGPQIQPWTCAEGALDEQCNRETTYEFLYQSTGGGGLEAYDPENPPSDVAETTTDEGETVPYIVRVETGVLARDEYRIAVLYDPTQPWEPWAPQRGWNQKLVITHGSSCDTSYQQGSAPDVLDDTALSRGFAVMSHALDHNGHNCNIVTQAESLIMTKELLVERYGEIRYTIGSGCSGGAVAQYQVANAYPGVYQGITPACSFPDSWSSRMLYEDYSLLRRYFENPTTWKPGVVWGTDDIESTWGHPNPANAPVYNTAIAPVIDPSRSCDGVPDEDVYDAATNPDGVRCSLQDYMVSILGRREQDGFAGKPWDNVGVQYGLKGLVDGEITPQQFVDVNHKVGSRDIDYEWQAPRAAGDLPAIAAVYRSGAFNMANNLDQTAVIDLRGPDPGAFHDVYRVYATRARLDREHGNHNNHLIWRGPVALMGDPNFASEAIIAMDRWLAAAEQDTRDIPYAQKLTENRPEDVTDRCTSGGGEGSEVPSEVCDEIVQPYSTARIEAGMPYTDDVAKCQLKPLLESDYYPIRFTAEEWAALQEVFPTGVCDYSKPGVEQQDTIPWATFADGPGGQPMGPAPVSVPFGPPGSATVERYSGVSRIETAIAVSGRDRDSADTVLIARADDHADALAAGPLAVALDAPLLLSDSAALTPATRDEVRRLGAANVILLGGEAALAPAVAESLGAAGVDVRRISGRHRYATAAAIAAELPDSAGVVVASGASFPDALSASALAAALRQPVLLADRDALPQETAARLDESTDVTVVGGPAALSDAVLGELDAAAGSVRRVSGPTRYATSAAAARAALDAGASPAVTWIATGNAFPDALVAAAAAGRDDGWLLLVDGADLGGSPETRDALAERAADIEVVRIAGGRAAVTEAVEAALAAQLQGG